MGTLNSIIKKRIIMIIGLILILNLSLSASEREKYVLGIPPWGGKQDDVKERFENFVVYLEEKLGKKVEFRVSDDYMQLGEDVYSGKIDIAIISSNAYVYTREKYPELRYLCTALDKKSKRATYSSYIIANKENGIRGRKDLENKKFAFVDENSSSGYKFPLALMMTKWGIDPDIYFKKMMFLGTHPDVFEAVKTGQADAGAVSEEYLDDAKVNNFIVVIDKVENIPYDGVVVTPRIGDETYEKIKALFLSLNETTTTKSGKNVLDKFPWAGF